MIIEDPLRLARELKGAPLSILFVLGCIGGQRVNQEYLERKTGYTDKPVSQALAYLQEIGLIDRTSAGWQLTGQARQLPLPVGLIEDGIQQPEVGTASEASRNISDSQSLDSLDLDLEDLTTDSLDSPVGIFPTPAPAGAILHAACELFGKRIQGKPSEYDDTRLLLGWIAQAWDTRGSGKGKTHSPAGLVYWAFHKGRGEGPAGDYLDHPEDYLPDSFLDAAGLPIPEEDPVVIEPEPDLDPGPTPVIGASVNLLVNAGSLTAKQAWQQAKTHLEGDLNQANYETWLRPSELVDYEPAENRFTVAAANAFAADWLEQRLKSQTIRTLTGICGRSATVVFVSS